MSRHRAPRSLGLQTPQPAGSRRLLLVCGPDPGVPSSRTPRVRAVTLSVALVLGTLALVCSVAVWSAWDLLVGTDLPRVTTGSVGQAVSPSPPGLPAPELPPAALPPRSAMAGALTVTMRNRPATPVRGATAVVAALARGPVTAVPPPPLPRSAATQASTPAPSSTRAPASTAVSAPAVSAPVAPTSVASLAVAVSLSISGSAPAALASVAASTPGAGTATPRAAAAPATRREEATTEPVRCSTRHHDARPRRGALDCPARGLPAHRGTGPAAAPRAPQAGSDPAGGACGGGGSAGERRPAAGRP